MQHFTTVQVQRVLYQILTYTHQLLLAYLPMYILYIIHRCLSVPVYEPSPHFDRNPSPEAPCHNRKRPE